MTLGSRVYGVGIMALGVTTLWFADFNPGQTVPPGWTGRTALVYVTGLLLLVSGGAVEWRRTARWGAAAIAAYYIVIVVFLMNGRLLLAGYGSYGIYEEIALQLAIPLAALIVLASTSEMRAVRAAQLVSVIRMMFGVCSLVWGGAHFVYMNMTAPLVPKWLPPGQVFWGYVTGACFVAAGLALSTGVKARLAAALLTVMIAVFGVLANGRVLVADFRTHFNWTESALNLALVGSTWVLADSLRTKRRTGT